MGTKPSFTEHERARALALLQAGHGYRVISKQLGMNSDAVRRLSLRWRAGGSEAVVNKPRGRKTYPIDVKLEVVERHLAGVSKVVLANEYGLSSPGLVSTWTAKYREGGPDALGGPGAGTGPVPPPVDPAPVTPAITPDDSIASELARLQDENEFLRAKVALLGKVQALRTRPPQ